MQFNIIFGCLEQDLCRKHNSADILGVGVDFDFFFLSFFFVSSLNDVYGFSRGTQHQNAYVLLCTLHYLNPLLQCWCAVLHLKHIPLSLRVVGFQRLRGCAGPEKKTNCSPNTLRKQEERERERERLYCLIRIIFSHDIILQAADVKEHVSVS